MVAEADDCGDSFAGLTAIILRHRILAAGSWEPAVALSGHSRGGRCRQGGERHGDVDGAKNLFPIR